MIINSNCKGNNIVEKNKSRIRKIQLEIQRDCKIVDTLYNQSDYETFKNFLCKKVVFEDIPDSECIRIYNCVNKEQFKSWYEIRGTKGVYDLITYYKIYKK